MLIYNKIAGILAKKDFLTAKSPGRINIIGEHTDYNDGLCMPAAIDKHIYFGIVPAHETEIISLDQHNSWSPSQNTILPDWHVYFKGVMQLLKEQGYSWPYFKLAFGGDLPVGAGLSSSSAITCGFISLLNQFAGCNMELKKLTQYAVQAEKTSGLDGGMMDQICILNAKKDHALYLNCENWKYEYLGVLLPHTCWLVVDTKVKHRLTETDYNARSQRCKEINTILTKNFPGIKSISRLDAMQREIIRNKFNSDDNEMIDYILAENHRVYQMKAAIGYFDSHQMGRILYAGHEGLRKLYKVSCIELDFLVNYAQISGIAYGARMMGGGFGGATIHLVPQEEKENYATGIANAYSNRFGFSPGVFEAVFSEGVRIEKSSGIL